MPTLCSLIHSICISCYFSLQDVNYDFFLVLCKMGTKRRKLRNFSDDITKLFRSEIAFPSSLFDKMEGAKNWRQFVAVRLCRKLHIILLSFEERIRIPCCDRWQKEREIIWCGKYIKISFRLSLLGRCAREVAINCKFRRLSICFVCLIRNLSLEMNETGNFPEWKS